MPYSVFYKVEVWGFSLSSPPCPAYVLCGPRMKTCKVVDFRHLNSCITCNFYSGKLDTDFEGNKQKRLWQELIALTRQLSRIEKGFAALRRKNLSFEYIAPYIFFCMGNCFLAIGIALEILCFQNPVWRKWPQGSYWSGSDKVMMAAIK